VKLEFNLIYTLLVAIVVLFAGSALIKCAWPGSSASACRPPSWAAA
jgi:hypothetical protein